MILLGEDFAWYDDAQLTEYSLRGISFPPTIWVEGARFYPLGLQQFNLIAHLTRSVAGYHAFAIAELLVVVLILLVLDDELSIAARTVLILFTLLLPGIVVSFMGLIYMERDIVFLLVCFALSVKMFERGRSVYWALATVACAQLMLYLKEPVFLLLLGFAGSRLILRKRPRGEESRLDWLLVAMSLAFLAFYAFMMLPRTSSEYLASYSKPFWETVRFYVKEDPLVWVFAAILPVRMFRILRNNATANLLWDGLACGGVLYFLAYLALRMTNEYFLAPVDLLAALYLGRLLLMSWAQMRPGFRIAAATAAVAIVYLELPLTAFKIFERKYFLHEKIAIANVILERYHRDPPSAKQLFFPFTKDFQLSEFAAYLNYRGLPIEDDLGASGPGYLQISGAKFAKVARCMGYKRFVCHPGSAADPGSLIVVLPDDDVSAAEKLLDLGSRQTLLSYNAWTHLPQLVILLFHLPRYQWVLWEIHYWPTAFVGVAK